VKRNIDIELSEKGIKELQKYLRDYDKWLKAKSDELAKMLSEMGYNAAFTIMSGHIFDGETISSLRVVKKDNAHYVVMAESEAILFLEFGTGLMGYGHPEPHGMGPGTYPGQKHALDLKGWWFQTDDPRLIRYVDKDGQGWGHSYGMAPAMPMYTAVKTIEQDLERAVKAVFV